MSGARAAAAPAELWLPRPQPTPAPASASGTPLPTAVRVFEVGPRDGLQAEPGILPAAAKIEFCRRLLAAGVSQLEVTSFVPPTWIPQLADAEEVVAGLAATGHLNAEGPDAPRTIALVPNLRGLDRALAAGIRSVSVVVSATDSFAAANLNTTAEGSLARAAEVAASAAEAGVPVRGYLSMSFGDPWEGPVPPERVAEFAARLHAAGCSTIALSDTIGTGTPHHVRRVLELTVAAGVPVDAIALHLHDTYGLSLANVLAALEQGVAEFDSSAGGLGRCPYAPGAAGNLATEDLVWMLHGLGIETGLDLDALVATSQWMATQLGRPAPSRVVRALTAVQNSRTPANTSRGSTA
ncbi:hydroxymethylglutaryl-CoA lyase [Herbiconiux liukaitaii]|uniref:hydroxymethylglutaryl-CoA lyase n=1 Tax=Herbiconiux liukaitaii TaxID=3342799 RepID=UPI0035BA2126